MAMTCDTCQMPIEGRSIAALGKNYHPDHFLCCVCKQPITETTFHQKDGLPMCLKDFEANCPKCASCSEPITDRVVTALGKKWHDEHFVCKFCDATLSGQQFHEREGSAICHPCFIGKVADKCKACGEPIDSAVTVALDAKWHPDCFKCKKCDKVITAVRFKIDDGGFPCCEGC